MDDLIDLYVAYFVILCYTPYVLMQGMSNEKTFNQLITNGILGSSI